MDLKKDTREIDGLTFKTQQFPAMRGFKLLARLTKTIGPAMGALAQLDPSTDLSSVSGELMGALGGLDPDEAAALIPEILEKTSVTVEGKHLQLNTRENIDLAFSGRLRTMFMALGFALEVNYRDFLSGSAQGAPPPPAPSGE